VNKATQDSSRKGILNHDIEVSVNSQKKVSHSVERRAVFAAALGNILEWYDFAVYAFFATIIAKQFFSSPDAVTALLSAFAAFGVGFAVRPLGGIILGHLADVRGRKFALLVTMFMMAASTVMLGLIPSYHSIGVAATVLVVVARLFQGFSAGGEWGGATAFIVEWSPPNRRGLFGSFQQCSTGAGILLGSTVAAIFGSLMSSATLEAWGWRIPFFMGGILGPIGLYMRRNIDETPAFKRVYASAPETPAKSQSPVLLAAKAFGFAAAWNGIYYIFLAYMPTFAMKYLGLNRAEALWSNSAGLVALIVAVPFMGRLSDSIGRKPVLLTCCGIFIFLAYPGLSYAIGHPSIGLVLILQLFFGVSIATFSGPGPAAIAEIFPTRIRSTWMSFGYSIAAATFGGFAPFIATWLIRQTGNPISPMYFVIGSSIFSALVIFRLPETAGKELS